MQRGDLCERPATGARPPRRPRSAVDSTAGQSTGVPSRIDAAIRPSRVSLSTPHFLCQLDERPPCGLPRRVRAGPPVASATCSASVPSSTLATIELPVRVAQPRERRFVALHRLAPTACSSGEGLCVLVLRVQLGCRPVAGPRAGCGRGCGSSPPAEDTPAGRPRRARRTSSRCLNVCTTASWTTSSRVGQVARPLRQAAARPAERAAASSGRTGRRWRARSPARARSSRVRVVSAEEPDRGTEE